MPSDMPRDNDTEMLLKIKELLYAGIISEEEYNAKRQDILKRM